MPLTLEVKFDPDERRRRKTMDINELQRRIHSSVKNFGAAEFANDVEELEKRRAASMHDRLVESNVKHWDTRILCLTLNNVTLLDVAFVMCAVTVVVLMIGFGARVDRQAGSIEGVVWYDTISNGLVDEGENGLPSIVVSLWVDHDNNGVITDQEDTQVKKTTTDDDGFFEFVNVSPGNFLVLLKENEVGKFKNTSGNNPRLLKLTANEVQSVEFGYRGASICVTTWLDDNLDGEFDVDENKILELTIQLWNDTNDNAMLDNCDKELSVIITNSNGVYDFQNLESGNYLVQVTDKNNVFGNFTEIVHFVTLQKGSDYNNATFGLPPTLPSPGFPPAGYNTSLLGLENCPKEPEQILKRANIFFTIIGLLVGTIIILSLCALYHKFLKGIIRDWTPGKEDEETLLTADSMRKKRRESLSGPKHGSAKPLVYDRAATKSILDSKRLIKSDGNRSIDFVETKSAEPDVTKLKSELLDLQYPLWQVEEAIKLHHTLEECKEYIDAMHPEDREEKKWEVERQKTSPGKAKGNSSSEKAAKKGFSFKKLIKIHKKTEEPEIEMHRT